MVLSSPYRRSSGTSTQKGAVLFEFAIIVPILLILVAFLFLLGRLIWQYQLLCDAAKYGARAAAMASEANTSYDCATLKAVGRDAAIAYRDNNSKWGISIVWSGDPEVTTTPSIGFAGTRIRMIKVKFSAGGTRPDNCLFCYAGWNKKQSLDAYALMDLHYSSVCQGEP